MLLFNLFSHFFLYIFFLIIFSWSWMKKKRKKKKHVNHYVVFISLLVIYFLSILRIFPPHPSRLWMQQRNTRNITSFFAAPKKALRKMSPVKHGSNLNIAEKYSRWRDLPSASFFPSFHRHHHKKKLNPQWSAGASDKPAVSDMLYNFSPLTMCFLKALEEKLLPQK